MLNYKPKTSQCGNKRRLIPKKKKKVATKLTDLQARAIKYHSVFKACCTSEYKFGPDSECIITKLNPRGPVHGFYNMYSAILYK